MVFGKTGSPVKMGGFGFKFIVSLVFLLAGAYSIFQLLGIHIPMEVPKEILLWITSIGCLLFGIFYMFKKKKTN